MIAEASTDENAATFHRTAPRQILAALPGRQTLHIREKRSRTRLFDYLLDRQLPRAGTLAVLVAVLEASVDWSTWVELDVSAVYGIPLVLAAVARNVRLLWALAACLVGVTFGAYATQIGPPGFYFGEPFFINRVLSAIALALSAALCHVWIVAGNRLAAQRQSLIEQNRQLDHLRQMAEDASGHKSQLLASVSHDIRTPLNSINLIADLILRSEKNPNLAARLPELVQRLQCNTQSLADLVSALVDISSLDAGRTDVKSSEFSLNELLAEECERLLPLAQAKGLYLRLAAGSPTLRVKTDRIKLTRVLTNLIGNAIKFTEAGGITVTSFVENAESVIRVSDTGIGMAQEDLARIFDEYGKLGNSQRDASKGWGLGLAICRRLVGVLGGHITVESEPGRGTTFSVRLPAARVLT